MGCLTYSFPSLFVWLLVCELLAWRVPMFPRPMSLVEVRMRCRLGSTRMFQSYPWRCRGAWRMLSILLWFLFEYYCLGYCLWRCISVPGRCSIQRSRSECYWHWLYLIYEGVVAKRRWLRYSPSIFKPSLSSEYAFECCREQLRRYGVSLSYSSPDVDRVVFFV